MLKMLGVIIVITCGTAIGIIFSNILYHRVDFLEQMLKMICFIENEIKYSADSLINIIEKFDARGNFKNFIFYCIEGIKKDFSFSSSWDNAISQTYKLSGLSEKQVNIIKNLGNSLGLGDVETQTSVCNLYKSLIEEELILARENKTTKSKLYITLGACGSIALVLILI